MKAEEVRELIVKSTVALSEVKQVFHPAVDSSMLAESIAAASQAELLSKNIDYNYAICNAEQHIESLKAELAEKDRQIGELVEMLIGEHDFYINACIDRGWSHNDECGCCQLIAKHKGGKIVEVPCPVEETDE